MAVEAGHAENALQHGEPAAAPDHEVKHPLEGIWSTWELVQSLWLCRWNEVALSHVQK